MGTLGGDRGQLGVVLASPPLTDGLRTMRRLEIVTQILGYTSFKIANLFPVATHSVNDITKLGADGGVWLGARDELSVLGSTSTALLMAYGVTEPTGSARSHRRGQIDWLSERLQEEGHFFAWHVGTDPRHPSRWHQYLSDRRGRTDGGTFNERLSRSLVELSVSELLGRSRAPVAKDLDR